MFLLRTLTRFLFTTVDTGGGGGGGEPAPAPAPAPEGTPAPAAAPAAAALPVDIFATEPADLVKDDAPYRDVVPVRDALAAAKQEYGPIAAALATLPPPLREAWVAFAPAEALTVADPALAPDVSYLRSEFSSMHPDDQAAVRQMIANGDGAALKAAAVAIRGDEGADPDGPETDAFGFPLDDPNRPMTRAETEQMWQERSAQAQRDREIADNLASMQREMKELGYDPAATDPVERAKATTLVSALATTPNGTVAQAHETSQAAWEKYDQGIIDDYVAGNRRTADRPVTTDPGAPPSNERKLSTLEEMDAAANEHARAIAAQRAQR